MLIARRAMAIVAHQMRIKNGHSVSVATRPLGSGAIFDLKTFIACVLLPSLLQGLENHTPRPTCQIYFKGTSNKYFSYKGVKVVDKVMDR